MPSRRITVTRSSMPPYEEFIEEIKPLWESRWLTNMGVYHNRLENALQDYLGSPYISLTSNGHMALELLLQAFDFPEGAEVITTPFTFMSTTNAIIRNRLKPVFCDISAIDGTIDADKIESLITDKTKAILPVHVYGNPCDTEKIGRIASKYGLKLVYDAAHAFGVRIYSGENTEKTENIRARDDKETRSFQTQSSVGISSFGDASIFSFHATKVFNTVEGGCIASGSKGLYDRIYDLKNFGIRGEEKVVYIGSNAKLNEFSSIMGLLNLKYIDRSIDDRKRAYLHYKEGLSEKKGIRILEGRKCIKNYSYLPVEIGEDYPVKRDDLYMRLKENGIFARKYFYPLTSDMEVFKGKYLKENLPNARKLSSRILTLPLYEGLSDGDIDMILSYL